MPNIDVMGAAMAKQSSLFMGREVAINAPNSD